MHLQDLTADESTTGFQASCINEDVIAAADLREPTVVNPDSDANGEEEEQSRTLIMVRCPDNSVLQHSS
jgi:hypothetical protein